MSDKRLSISGAVQARLKKARVARLSTLDSKRRPHIVPICFVYDCNFFYTAIDEKPKRVVPQRLARLRNLVARPQVALLIDEYDEDWTRLWFVLIRGRAEVIPMSARRERGRAISKLREKYRQYTGTMLHDDTTIIRIAAERITSWGNFEQPFSG
jgi:PPOX class probable F420-dependent enzyme